MPPNRGLREAVGVVSELIFYRSNGKIANLPQPPASFLGTPLTGGTRPNSVKRAFMRFSFSVFRGSPSFGRGCCIFFGENAYFLWTFSKIVL